MNNDDASQSNDAANGDALLIGAKKKLPDVEALDVLGVRHKVPGQSHRRRTKKKYTVRCIQYTV